MDTNISVKTLNETAGILIRKIEDNVFLQNHAISSIRKLAKHIIDSDNVDLGHDPNIRRRRNYLTVVEVKSSFLKIENINTISQDFEAEILIQAKWEEPILDFTEAAKQQTIKGLYNEKRYWDPLLIITNVMGPFNMESKVYNVKFQEAGYDHTVVVMVWRFSGKFRENLELEHYPFDVQDLTIQVSSERTIDEIDIIEDKHSMSTVNINMFQDTQEWSVYQHVECTHKLTTREHASCTVHPLLFVQCRLLILGLAFSTLSIDADNPDRMACTVTLFLTAVFFKLVVKTILPTISYLTYLDIYILATMVYLTMQAAESSIMCALAKWIHVTDVVIWDEWTLTSFGVILIAFHLIFAFNIYNTAMQRRRLMKQKDKEYGKKRDYLDHHGVLLSAGYSSLKVDDE